MPDTRPTGAPSTPNDRSVLVIVPTYNEIANLPDLATRLFAAEPRVDLLVVDDASPDGTGELADTMAAEDPRVSVLHRQGKDGLGAAYRAGFRWALDRGYDAVVEMDADGSHRPEQLHRLLDALAEADLVIGSRWVPGGSVHNWPLSRRVLSQAGNRYIRAALRMPVADATGGYRVFRSSALTSLDLDSVSSQGYCFQVDLTRRADEAGLRVREVPIDFHEREQGVSKMSGSIISEALMRVTGWGVQRRLRRLAPAR